MRLVLLLTAVISATASANPVAVPTGGPSFFGDIYISSEKLAVIIGPGDAEFNGTFTFKSAKRVWGDIDYVTIAVPIWFPAEAQNGDPAISAFWAVFNDDYANLGSTTEGQTVKKILGLRAHLDDRELRPVR